MEDDQTWEFIQIPKGKKATPCKYKKKNGAQENEESRYKTRLVAKEFS